MKNNIELYPIETLTEPKNGVYRIYKDYFWIIDKENNIMKFKGMSWQCNVNQNVAENIRDKCYPGFTVLQIPLVYIEWKD